MRITRTGKTAILSAAHAAVDFCCAALFFRVLKPEELLIATVLYNACAFLFQLPLGIVADRLDRNLLFAAAGCVLVAAGSLLTAVPIAAVIVAGLGNGAFHVGGGIEVLNGSKDKAGPLGVFVSPGAIGLFFGRFYAKTLPVLPVIVSLMAICAAAILLSGKSERKEGSHNAPLSFAVPKGGAAALTLLFLVVVLRSFTGFTAAFSTGGFLSGLPALLAGLIPVLCLALGKAAGGFLADRFGAIPASVVSLGLCAAMLFFPLHPALTLAALFLFNMSMPITLFAAAKILRGAKGTAFGLLTAALSVGLVPLLLGAALPPSPVLFGSLAAASAVLLVPGLLLCRTK
jgi:FSR family fosmidomycin resistance protein-like MFS transporter